LSDYEHMTNADVMSGEELAEYERDGEYRLDAQEEAENARLEREAEERLTEDGEDFDCGAPSPDTECGVCAGCQEARGDDIEAQCESGSITYGEAVDAHVLNGTWG
jgi:hypothetical protein